MSMSMSSVTSSWKAYGKIDEAEQQRLEARRKSRKRIVIISLSSIFLVAVIVGAVVGTVSHHHDGSAGTGGEAASSISNSIKAACKVTLYPDSCYTSLYAMVNSSNFDTPNLAKLSVQVAMTELSKVSGKVSQLQSQGKLDKISAAALQNCIELTDLAIYHLNDTLYSSNWGQLTTLEAVDDLRTWLSAAGTNQQTCLDGLENSSQELQATMARYTLNSTEFTSNSLALVTAISDIASSINLRRRRLMSSSGTTSTSHNVDDSDGEHPMPRWLTSKDRKLLQSNSAAADAMVVIVAKDGSGNYTTIGAALNALPEKSSKRIIIHVKKGVYTEKVIVDKSKWNVMMVGDGMNVSIVSGSLNVVDGTPTFSSATVAVFGKGFIARDIGFRNTAGAIKQQAVALLSAADESVFYRCSIDAFQDTLYTHSLRQFYCECDIYGTVDFIFGNAAVVFQNCNIWARVPLSGQQNTITAQGKIDPNQNTGISIHNCTISAFGNLASVNSYLGRPWKNYSTTVYMRSTMGSFINPAGWLSWMGNTPPTTIFYAEFRNLGLGSSTKNRVKWKGLRKLTLRQARQFTVGSFIQGNNWLPQAGVTYRSGM
ncbi:probable pectinesterase/pectinesterase inhibitor 46 [Macadamia integrifolia]|uniref:probable pectinesterase/pectinesterase inhibitor 46 n=1 Tax=Macadamia integrifolia TaxID=60698 RepID=UPI001C4F758E|nr:probable pectinesterase/pectinesterase inhibitor 46 [Macadamia integrifolia]